MSLIYRLVFGTSGLETHLVKIPENKKENSRKVGHGSVYFFLLVVFPDPRFEFPEVIMTCLCHFPHHGVGNGFGEIMFREGVYGPIIDHEKGTICAVHKLVIAPVWPF